MRRISNAADAPAFLKRAALTARHSRLLAKIPVWPNSLARRTLLTLLVGLVVVQGAGLTIHAFDRMKLQRFAELRDLGMRSMSIYRTVVGTAPGEREAALREMELGPYMHASLGGGAAVSPEVMEPPYIGQIRVNMGLVQVRPANRPRDVVIRGTPWSDPINIGLQMPDWGWLNLSAKLPPPRPWHSREFLLAFVLMTAAAALLSIWAVRRLTGPVTLLAEAAERLGRDVNAPPLPEQGPDEVVRAAVAFNTMAARIRRFVQDRTFLLTAIGHDLRTPITRLKLRAEFIEDDEQRQKFMADLDELDAMVSATLVFGRDTADTEPAVPFDLVALLRTVLDDAADARPGLRRQPLLRRPRAPHRARPHPGAEARVREPGGQRGEIRRCRARRAGARRRPGHRHHRG